MIRRLRLLVVLARPAVLVLLALFAATGLAQAGRAGDHLLLARVLVVVAAFLLFSVAVNDLTDEAIDRVNLAGDRRRPLVVGTARRRDLRRVAGAAAVTALLAAAALGWRCLALVAAGLAVSAAYSVRPVRVADRGAVASLLLPFCYVAVPYLLGLLAAARTVRFADLVLLAGLYVGFIGRILLKDFRDVRGDALFGKRTVLVRYGRRRTCSVSAACWVAGAALLLAGVGSPPPSLVLGYVLGVAAALGLLRALAAAGGPRRDEALISATAIVGRGLLLLLLAHLSIAAAGWSGPGHDAALAALVLVLGAQAYGMARYGPSTRTAVPPDWTDARAGSGTGPRSTQPARRDRSPGQ